jgi:stage V sporulation protein R
MSLPCKLKTEAERIAEFAREYGLDFYETIFEMTDARGMNELAAYGGFPMRYPHWRYGMEYDRLRKGKTYGLSHIYEMVINNDPCYAYLLETNRLVDHQMVMAHVYGHSDFFKNNVWFSRTNRHMIDRMAQNAGEVSRIIEKQGFERVEQFMDAALSLEDLIDPYSVFREPPPETDEDDERRVDIASLKFHTKEYLDSFVNPKERLEQELARIQKELDRHRDLPRKPERDVLHFLIQQAPLKPWQRRLLGILREEAYYFVPQGTTKVMNEGWASYWHIKIMTTKVLADENLTAYADHCSRTLAMPPGSFNPYRVGLAIWLDIEDRWNKGRFGREWEACDDYARRQQWDTGADLGRQKMFEVRRFHNDVTFIDTFFTRELCAEQKLFTTRRDGQSEKEGIESRDFAAVKKQLLFMLSNMGRPVIEVVSNNFENRSELLLRQQHYGIDLDLRYAKETLKNLALIWTRPVHLETSLGGKAKLISHTGEGFEEREIVTDKAVQTTLDT